MTLKFDITPAEAEILEFVASGNDETVEDLIRRIGVDSVVETYRDITEARGLTTAN